MVDKKMRNNLRLLMSKQVRQFIKVEKLYVYGGLILLKILHPPDECFFPVDLKLRPDPGDLIQKLFRDTVRGKEKLSEFNSALVVSNHFEEGWEGSSQSNRVLSKLIKNL